MKIYFKVFIKISLFNICIVENSCFLFLYFFILSLFFFFSFNPKRLCQIHFRNGFRYQSDKVYHVERRYLKNVLYPSTHRIHRTSYYFYAKIHGGFRFRYTVSDLSTFVFYFSSCKRIRTVRAHTILRYCRFNPLYYPKWPILNKFKNSVWKIKETAYSFDRSTISRLIDHDDISKNKEISTFAKIISPLPYFH